MKDQNAIQGIKFSCTISFYFSQCSMSPIQFYIPIPPYDVSFVPADRTTSLHRRTPETISTNTPSHVVSACSQESRPRSLEITNNKTIRQTSAPAHQHVNVDLLHVDLCFRSYFLTSQATHKCFIKKTTLYLWPSAAYKSFLRCRSNELSI